MIKESLERKGNGPMSEKKLEKNTLSHSLHEECGVFGMYDFDGNDVARTIYYGLFALQHRGQESCGIAVWHIEVPEELPLEALKPYGFIGLTAGASTPRSIIDAVQESLKAL